MRLYVHIAVIFSKFNWFSNHFILYSGVNCQYYIDNQLKICLLISSSFFSLNVYQGTTQVIDSGPLYDSRITGGRIGVYQFGAFSTIWSNLKIHCIEHTNKALYFEGTRTYLTLSNVKDLARLTFSEDLRMDKR